MFRLFRATKVEALPVPAVTDKPAAIEVGEIKSDGLRLWCAREAQRQAETRLAAQMDALNRMIGRATSGLGWNVTLSLALIGALAKGVAAALWYPLICTTLAAVCCLLALWPRAWVLPGHSASWLLSMPHTAEMYVVEDMAMSAEQGAQANGRRLTWLSWSLRLVSVLMILAVILAALAISPWAGAFLTVRSA